MKRFRKITAITLTLVVIAMLAISASAASFSRSVSGDFGQGVGAVFNGNLTTSEVRADAVFYGAEEDYIDLVQQSIQIEGRYASWDTPHISESVRSSKTTYGNDTVAVLETVSYLYHFQNATYTYNAYYIANGVVDCYMNDGPVRLINT